MCFSFLLCSFPLYSNFRDAILPPNAHIMEQCKYDDKYPSFKTVRIFAKACLRLQQHPGAHGVNDQSPVFQDGWGYVMCVCVGGGG